MEERPLFDRMKDAREKINRALIENGLTTKAIVHGQHSLYSSDQYPEKVTEEAVRAGVMALAAMTNIQGSSLVGANLWLCDVVFSYLTNPEVRAEMNHLAHGNQ